MVGRTVLHYQIIEKLGAGGMGVVWKALDTRLGRAVALKFLPDTATADPVKLDRFIREARAASALNHPNIVTIYEINSDGDLHFIAMELIHGRALSDVLRASKQVAPAEAVHYMIQCCDGLAKAHAARIVHRDIKPSNIMLTADGLVKILDFGLAKLLPQSSDLDSTHSAPALTVEGVAMGTIPYMSPEQAAGELAGPRSDVFSTGIVLYEMLAGRRPFDGPSIARIMGSLICEDPPALRSVAPHVPGALVAIVDKCLKKVPEARYADAGELAADLRAFERVSSGSYSPAQETVVRAEPGRAARVVRGLFHRPYVVILPLLGMAIGAGYVAFSMGTNSSTPLVAAAPAEAFRSARAYLQRYDLKGNVDRAIEALLPAVTQDPSNAALHAVLAEGYLLKYPETGDRAWLQKAAESARQGVAANGDLAAAHVAQGMTLAENGQNEQAATELERAVDLDPLSSPARLALAKVRFAQGQVKEAEQLHLEAARLAPGDWIVTNWLGVFYYRTARYSDAVGTWRKALDLSTDNVVVLRNLGPGYYASGDYGQAAAAFQRALELDPTSVPTWANLGTARYFEGRYAEAAGALEKAVQLAPNNYLYWGNLGDAYRWAPGSRNKATAVYANAIRLVREKLALDLNDTAVRGSLAVYLAKAGDTASALSEVAQIDRTPSNSPGSVFKTALVYELGRDRGKALDALGRAMRAGYSRSEVDNEPEFADLRSDPRYREVVRIIPAER